MRRLVRWVVPAVVAGCGVGPAPDAPAGSGTSVDRGSFAGSVRPDSVRTARLATLRAIDASNTYLGAMLVELDSVLRRWPERLGDPIRVHIPEGDGVGADEPLRSAARDAFRRWERVGAIPVRFAFTDSAAAEVHVRWVRQFTVQRTGQADVTWSGGWIRHATLTLATLAPAGWPLTGEAVFTVALHEIGHLLGLGHSDQPGDVMYPTTEIQDLTSRDRQTARFLYALPPGSLKLPG